MHGYIHPYMYMYMYMYKTCIGSNKTCRYESMLPWLMPSLVASSDQMAMLGVVGRGLLGTLSHRYPGRPSQHQVATLVEQLITTCMYMCMMYMYIMSLSNYTALFVIK